MNDDAELQPGPVILALPVVPPGTNRLVTVDGGKAWVRHGRAPGGGPERWMCQNTFEVLSLANLLQEYGEVLVQNREPRVFPRLDPAPEDLQAFRGASGAIYVRAKFAAASDGAPLYKPSDLPYARRLSRWQEIDGPLTEVLDVPEDLQP